MVQNSLSPMLIGNRYRLINELGSGGMGIVYKAQDRLNNRRVALKRLVVPTEYLAFMSMSASSNLLYSLAKEFEMLASLRHPNIISVLDYGFDKEQQPYLTMEFLEDAELFTTYARSQAHDTQTELLIQMLQALVYLHRRGIIHRDLKPGNVVVVEGQVKVLDFGLSLKQGEAAGQEGTIGYMAPEVLAGEASTEASDLYAVGVIAYELFAGQLPLYHGDVEYYMEAILSQQPDIELLDTTAAMKSIIGKLLAKKPQERYGSAVDVIHALAAISGQKLEESAAIRESFLQAATFVGRDAELNQLVQAFDNAVAGQGSVWLVGGESGVGKSRLIDELRTQALVQGIQVLRGQGVAEGGLPYQLWRDVVRRLVLSTTLSELAASVLKEIVPDIGELIGCDVPDAPKLEGKPGQQRLQLTILEMLKQQEQPLLILLEDLHWTQESLEPIKLLLHQVAKLNLLVIGSYRDDERSDLPKVLGEVNLLKLERLTNNDIENLSVSMLGDGGSAAAVVNLLQRETEGNVFFLVEVVRALAEAAGSLDDIGQMTLPRAVFAGGVQQVIRRRLDKIPDIYHPLLNFAAVTGRQLDLAILEKLKGTVDMSNWLVTCQDAAVLEVRDDNWRFAHDKLRETLLQDIEIDARSIIYRQVATAIEHTYPDDESYNETLLEHWHQAGDIDRELDYLPKVGEYLVKIAAEYSRAQLLLQRGLTLLSDDDVRRVFLLNWLSQSYWRTGNYDQAAQQAEQATNLAQQTEDQSGLATSLNNMGLVLMSQGNHEDAREYYQHSLDIMKSIDNQAGIAASLHNLGVVTFNQGNYEGARDFYEQSLIIRQSIEDQFGIAASLNNLGNVYYFLDNTEQALRSYEKSLSIKRSLGDQRSIANSLNNIGNVHYYQGNYESARSNYLESLAIREVIGDQYGISEILYNLGGVASDQEDERSAFEYYQQSLIIRRAIGSQRGIADCLNHLGFIDLGLRLKSAIVFFREALAIGQSSHLIPSILASLIGFTGVYLQQSQPARAAQLLVLVKDHPSFNPTMQKQWEKFDAQVKEVLSPSELEVTLEKRKTVDIDAIVGKVLSEFGED